MSAARPAVDRYIATFHMAGEPFEVRASDEGIGISQGEAFQMRLRGFSLPAPTEQLSMALSADDRQKVAAVLRGLGAFLDNVGRNLEDGQAMLEAVRDALSWQGEDRA